MPDWMKEKHCPHKKKYMAGKQPADPKRDEKKTEAKKSGEKNDRGSGKSSRRRERPT